MRAQVEFYERGADAAIDAAAVSEVGMGQRSVAAVWVVAADTQPGLPWEETVQGAFGNVRVIGWLAVGEDRASPPTVVDIIDRLQACEPDPGLRDRIEATLRAGGGLVAVRADDGVTV